MKITPEKKAILAYGKARGKVEERLSILNDATIRANIECGELDRKEYKELYDIDEAIRDAWKKRAACRAWNPPEGRDCRNCKYFRLPERPGTPCYNCPGLYNQIPHNWEPRKEGENETDA